MNFPPGFLEGNDDEVIQYLIANDYMDVSIDPRTEEPMFRMNKNCERDYPEFYAAYMKSVMEDVDDQIVTLIEKGYMEPAGMNAQGEMTFALTEFARDLLKEL